MHSNELESNDSYKYLLVRFFHSCIFTPMRKTAYPIWQSICFLVFTALVFSGCRTPFSYLANSPAVPMLREEGSSQFTGSFTTSRLELQAAYLPKKNLGVMANSYLDTRGRVLLEGGVGWVKPLTDFNMFDIYAGYGYGRINSDYSINDFAIFSTTREGEYSHFIKANFHRIFIQPTFSGNLSFDEQLGLSVKSSLVYYPNYEFRSVFNGFDGTFTYTADSDTLEIQNAIGFVFDPTITFRTLWGNSSLVVQGGYSFPFFSGMNGQAYEHPVYHRILFNLAYQHRFPRKKEGKKKGRR